VLSEVRPSHAAAGALSAALLLLIPASFAAAASRRFCTDQDRDGFFREGVACRTASDCDDRDRGRHPGGAEVCDGLDSDCDGQVDEAPGCPRACATPVVVGGAQPIGERSACGQHDPDLLWTGSLFVIGWDRGSCGRVEVAVADPFGMQIGPEALVPRLGDHPQVPSLVWTGSELVVAWNDLTADVFLTRLDLFGTPLGDAARITRASRFPSGQRVAWTGSELGVFWVDSRIEREEVITGQLAFARLRADGRRIGRTVLATPPGTVSVPSSLIWAGSFYALAYPRPSGLILTTLNASGRRFRDTLLTSTPAASDVSLVWTGSEIAAVWSDARDGVPEITFARFDASGRRTGPDVLVSDGEGAGAFAPSLAWTGAELGVSWTDLRHGNPEIAFARLDPSGAKIGEDLRVTVDAAASGPSLLRWTGDAYGIVFQDTRENPEGNIFFTRIGCE
jgi:hypothetical protein